MSTISGYAATFGDEAVIAGSFRERIQRGAFARSIRENDIVALLNHDSGRVLGRQSAGTLKLREDNIGLFFSLEVDETTPEGQTAVGTVGRQDVKGCSFGFRVRAEAWDDGDTRLPLRTLTDIDCHEITLTAFPAYESSSAIVSNRTQSGQADHNAAAARRRRAETAMRLRGIT